MADAVLLCHRKFGGGLAKLRNQKDRVVAKAIAAQWLVDYETLFRALSVEDAAVRQRNRDDCLVSRRAKLRWYVSQGCEEAVYTLFLIAAVPTQDVVQRARLTIEGVDLEAGIVRERGEAGGATERFCLEPRVLGVGLAGLVDVEYEADAMRRNQLPAAVTKKVAELRDLPCVVRCD